MFFTKIFYAVRRKARNDNLKFDSYTKHMLKFCEVFRFFTNHWKSDILELRLQNNTNLHQITPYWNASFKKNIALHQLPCTVFPSDQMKLVEGGLYAYEAQDSLVFMFRPSSAFRTCQMFPLVCML